MASIADLDARIQNLPQELQDMILGFTEAFETPATIAFTKDYKPPLGLQLNRTMRAEFAKRYYETVVFEMSIFSSSPTYLQQLEAFKRWLSVLTSSHQKAQQTVRVTLRDPQHSSWKNVGRSIYNSLFLAVVKVDLACSDKLEKLHLEFIYVDEDGGVKCSHMGDYAVYHK
ncbi:uncharacterized protein RCC_09166 [Ramularia collo-cygni]|uniref:Uncharacterized protein n=1 Tax=Ramularia collo-cygni TaxID=112498 RepID=A0A2D3VEF8_9PEZI|nr:uncharacterized protein RCC_09166 [Ramularia collo-cygni]CZT23452.1 uncharacterized protein RCC_09166 [Ramularia collo-cygni]